MTSSFAKENSQRSTNYVIEARYVKEKHDPAFFKLPAFKYIVSYYFLIIKQPYTDLF